MQTQAVRDAIQQRFGVPFAGVEFTLDLDRKLVVVEAIRRAPPLQVIKAGGEFVLYVGEPNGHAYRHRVVPNPGFDVHHLLERCQAITALLGYRVEFKDHAILAPQDC